MGIFKQEDIVAFEVDGEIVCLKCMIPADHKGLTQENIITQQNVEESYAFCDRCGEALN